MQASDLISSGLFPLKPGDSCDFAIEMMDEWEINHLPVVLEKELLGILCRKDLIDIDLKKKIDGLWVPLNFYKLEDNSHLFQLLGIFGETQFSVLPVSNASGEYTGMISLPHLLQLTGQLLTVSQEGAIISLVMNPMDYSLTEISRFAENDNIKIMGLLINQPDDSGRIHVHLKMNSWQVNRFVGTLGRFNYQISGVYTTAAALDDLRGRYDALMKYLDI